MSLIKFIGRNCRSRTREPSRPNHYVYWIIEFDSSVVDTWTKLRSSGTSIAQDLLPGRTQRLCIEIFPHYFDHNFRTKFFEGWVYVMPHILTPTYLSLRLITVYLLIICRLSYTSFWHVICDYLMMLWCYQDYALIMILWCYHAYIMLWSWGYDN